jgi:diaminopimelate epimerase
MMMRRFVLLSSDMVDCYVSNLNPHAVLAVAPTMMTRNVAVAQTLEWHPSFKNKVPLKVVDVALDGIHLNSYLVASTDGEDASAAKGRIEHLMKLFK